MTPPPRPTRAEFEILGSLWKLGPSTVRQVHEHLRTTAAKETGYTTVLKLLQNMTEKGLVARDERERTHVYSARVSEKRTQRELVKDLVERAFGGSAASLAIHALSMKRASPEELEEIRRLLDAREGEKK